MGLTVHPNVTLRKMDHLGENYNEILKKWISEICVSLNCKHMLKLAF